MLLTEFASNLTAALSATDARGREIEIGRAHLKVALEDTEFVLDTIARQLEIMRIPIDVLRQRPISFARSPHFHIRLIYWAPNYAVTPHEHDEWTVGGVLLNEVEVAIYDRIDAPTPSRVFLGREGDVGTLDPPTVHQLINRTTETSVTMHLFGHGPFAQIRTPGDRGAKLADGRRDATEIDAENLRQYRAGLRQRMELSIVNILAKRPSGDAMKLLRVVADIGSDETKAAVVKATARMDLEVARRAAV